MLRQPQIVLALVRNDCPCDTYYYLAAALVSKGKASLTAYLTKPRGSRCGFTDHCSGDQTQSGSEKPSSSDHASPSGP